MYIADAYIYIYIYTYVAIARHILRHTHCVHVCRELVSQYTRIMYWYTSSRRTATQCVCRNMCRAIATYVYMYMRIYMYIYMLCIATRDRDIHARNMYCDTRSRRVAKERSRERLFALSRKRESERVSLALSLSRERERVSLALSLSRCMHCDTSSRHIYTQYVCRNMCRDTHAHIQQTRCILQKYVAMHIVSQYVSLHMLQYVLRHNIEAYIARASASDVCLDIATQYVLQNMSRYILRYNMQKKKMICAATY